MHVCKIKLKTIKYKCDGSFKICKWMVVYYSFLKGRVMTHVEGI